MPGMWRGLRLRHIRTTKTLEADTRLTDTAPTPHANHAPLPSVSTRALGTISYRVKLRGDVGVIFGNEGGTKNAIRYLWSDRSPEVSINNDVPSEMRIHPNDMGTWVVE